jgi:hypothetical protein
LPEGLGDLDVKIKDILSEGFWQGAKEFGKGALAALPSQTMQTVLRDIKKPVSTAEPTDIELAKAAHKKFADPSDNAENWANWLTPEQLQQREQQAVLQKQKKLAVAKAFAQKTAQAAKTALQQPPEESPEYGVSKVPQGYRIAVTNPQGNATFYKYPDGRWTDEYGAPMPSTSHGALDGFADTRGRMETLPSQKVSGFKPKRGRKRG